ncbi:MAG: hypothetical protein WC877_00355 [Dehalococcoidales bacterium]|jgi:hypothetical protein
MSNWGDGHWLTPERMEFHRLSTKVWFRGSVTTIGEMERQLINEELDRLYPMGDNKDENIKIMGKHLEKVLDTKWRYDYLLSLDPDRHYKSKRVKS